MVIGIRHGNFNPKFERVASNQNTVFAVRYQSDGFIFIRGD
jgi:hypothetical protein